MDPLSGRGLIVSLFLDDRFYLIQCPDFIQVYHEMEGLSESGFDALVRKWLSQVGPSYLDPPHEFH